MLGFAPLAQLPIAAIPLQGTDALSSGGGGARSKRLTDYLPEQIGYREAPQPKPVKPIWDRASQVAQPQAPEPATPAGPPPLPPASIFMQPQTDRQYDLPDFHENEMDRPFAVKANLKRAKNESEALAALRALGLIKG